MQERRKDVFLRHALKGRKTQGREREKGGGKGERHRERVEGKEGLREGKKNREKGRKEAHKLLL